MAKWILKAVVQKGISYLPWDHKINYLLQKYVTKGIRLTDTHFEAKLNQVRNHLQYLRKYHTKHEDFTAVELGTGWYPVVPIGLYLCGAREITTVDLSDLMRHENILIAIRRFKAYWDAGKLTEHLPHASTDRAKNLFSVLDNIPADRSELLAKFSVRYEVADARKLNLPDQWADLIVSNNVFEHIYPDVLKDILKELKRISSADGISSHFIDMSDHFAHRDKSISIYNYLRFSSLQWKLIDNSIQPQNRLRINHYHDMYRQLGLAVLEQVDRPGNVDELRSLRLHSDFASLDPRVVAVSHSLIVSR